MRSPPTHFPLPDESTIDASHEEQHHDHTDDPPLSVNTPQEAQRLIPQNSEAENIHVNFVKLWNRFVYSTYPILLLLMILLLWPAGFFALRNLISKTDSTFRNPVPESPSSAAQQILTDKFPDAVDSTTHPTLLVVLQLNNQSNSTFPEHGYARDASLGLESFLNGRLGVGNATQNTIIQVSSYYSFQEANLSLLAQSFLSQDKRTTFLQVTPHFDGDNSTKQRLEDTMTAMDDYFFPNKSDDLDIGFTGVNYFSKDLRSSTQEDLKRMDTFVLPLALVLVGVTLLSSNAQQIFCCWTGRDKIQIFVVILLPLCGMISTVSTWSIIMDSFVVKRIQITQFTPSIMMSLTLGMGIDYTLFLMARYLSELRLLSSSSSSSSSLSTSPTTTSFGVVQIMLEQAGKVVVVSGTTLLCTFSALVALPLPMLQSVGIGASVAIASAMLMNLLVIPSLLYTPLMQEWLSPPPRHRDAHEEDAREPLLEDHTERATSTVTPQILSPSSTHESVWIRLARVVVHPYKSIILVLVILQVLLWPVAWNSHRLDASDLSFESLLPNDAPSLHTYHKFVDGGHFGPGKLAPYRIIMDGTKSNITMDTPDSFDLQHDLVQTLLHNNNNTLAGPHFVGVSVVNNVPIPYSIYLASKLCDDPTTSCSNDALRCLHYLDQEMMSSDRFTTYFLVELQMVSPFDKEGIQWLDETRLRIKEWTMNLHQRNATLSVDVYVDGIAAIAHDAVDAVYSSFPIVLASTLLIIFILLGCVFGSIMPPLRSMVSITFTLAVSFGLAVLVYQDGIFNTYHIRSLISVDPELSWLVPIMSFSIIAGLALDYDIFLVTRIYELRWFKGYGHESSIAVGLEETGGIITSAGMIMALSFGSLLASKSPALDQWAFLVTTAVLVDTFVVRTILVPAFMAWTGPTWSWYPRQVPWTTTPTTRLFGLDESDPLVDAPSAMSSEFLNDSRILHPNPSDIDYFVS